jgi:hypothetical protein
MAGEWVGAVYIRDQLQLTESLWTGSQSDEAKAKAENYVKKVLVAELRKRIKRALDRVWRELGNPRMRKEDAVALLCDRDRIKEFGEDPDAAKAFKRLSWEKAKELVTEVLEGK